MLYYPGVCGVVGGIFQYPGVCGVVVSGLVSSWFSKVSARNTNAFVNMVQKDRIISDHGFLRFVSGLLLVPWGLAEYLTVLR